MPIVKVKEIKHRIFMPWSEPNNNVFIYCIDCKAFNCKDESHTKRPVKSLLEIKAVEKKAKDTH